MSESVPPPLTDDRSSTCSPELGVCIPPAKLTDDQLGLGVANQAAKLEPLILTDTDLGMDIAVRKEAHKLESTVLSELQQDIEPKEVGGA